MLPSMSRDAHVITSHHSRAPPLIGLDKFSRLQPWANHVVNVERTLTISIEERSFRYSLAGIIYHGANHFTCRFFDSAGTSWYHDGADAGRECIYRLARLDDHISLARSSYKVHNPFGF
ncbi:uncharacterized protein LAESUDRAFT_470226 [Laetiporus sulphureus 93-53]|uniref:Uncharacterized protein n=1 Tax=Laetiporus sulphureus 93-53 TaxID=1314785 RepID=A0A165GA67_9APHY|nr:uncharacterized protein LAESUDRAFT_470226 [Laetiporus sulphureus 93-53]KZT10057.1 hypothetical protein LAESUDRAFT_470226 [Laetiporus sulphureus 93-53]